jgi:hypothetical protein
MPQRDRAAGQGEDSWYREQDGERGGDQVRAPQPAQANREEGSVLGHELVKAYGCMLERTATLR